MSGAGEVMLGDGEDGQIVHWPDIDNGQQKHWSGLAFYRHRAFLTLADLPFSILPRWATRPLVSDAIQKANDRNLPDEHWQSVADRRLPWYR